MEEETKVSDETAKSADAPKDEQKHRNVDVDAIIAERDKAKEAVRKYKEAEAKAKEAKMEEDGKLKELYTQTQAERDSLKAENEIYKAQEIKLRETLIAKLPEEDRDIATDIQDLDKLQKLVNKLTDTKVKPYNANGKLVSPTETEPRNMKEAIDKARAKGLI